MSRYSRVGGIQLTSSNQPSAAGSTSNSAPSIASRWSEGPWRFSCVIATGFAEYTAANPVRLLLTTTLPRAVLQCLFFTLLGQVAGGYAGERFAFVGALGYQLTLSTVIGIGEIPMLEKWSGTFYRLQLGIWPIARLFWLRSLPLMIQGAATVLLCMAIDGPLTVGPRYTLQLLPAIPIYFLIVVTTAAAGLAVTSLAVGRNSDTLVGNAFSYLIAVSGGVLIPADHVLVLKWIGAILPVSHGVQAVRAMAAGQAWAPQVVLEACTGLGWGLLAVGAYQRQVARARRQGIDDFA